jgi:electron transfer flavoprotein beta subunit
MLINYAGYKRNKMKILVCIKAVPDPESLISINGSGNWIRTSGVFRMSRFDETALEEALLLKDRDKSAVIDVISAGADYSKDVIRRAVGMGADGGIHIVCDAQGYVSPFLTASFIASYIKDNYYDLVFTGAVSEDCMQGQVGPLSAEMAGLPCVSFVVKQELSPDGKTVYVERETEGGVTESFEMTLPALVTVQGGINNPRYPSLSNMLRANRIEIKTIYPDTERKTDSRQTGLRLTVPEKKREGYVLSGSVQMKAAELIRILRQKAFIQ